MRQESNFFVESKETIQEYLQDRIALLRLEFTEKLSKLTANLFLALLMAILSLFILIFLSMMGGYYFAHLTGSNYIGFGIITGFYVVLMLVLLLGGKKLLTNFIINSIIKSVFDKTAEHPEDHDNNNTHETERPIAHQ